MLHNEKSLLAGKKVKIKKGIKHPQILNFGGSEILIEDWSDRVIGQSWMFANGNPACLIYAVRTGFSKLNIPTDNEVLYGKINGLGHLVHISELEILEKQ